jgi:homoserine kinase
MSFRIFAPATIGNVASGFDVLGLAVDELGDTFEVSRQSRYEIQVLGRDAELVPLDHLHNTVTIASEAFYRSIGIPSIPYKVIISRTLPLAGGLGSSAASSVAGALAASVLSGHENRTDLILRAALHAEGVVAGPHLDNIAPCFYGGLTLVQDIEKLSVYQIPLQKNLWISLVTPPIKIKTKDARRVLPEHLKTEQWTRQMAHCTSLALALARGDFEHLSFGMQDVFAEPARGPLIPHFFEAKQAAVRAGAFGFSISGSGPTCFAFSPDREKAEKVADAVQKVFGPESTIHVVQARRQGAVIL